MLAVNAWSADLAYKSGENAKRQRVHRTPEQRHAYDVKRATKALFGYRDYDAEKAQRARKRKAQDIEVAALAPLADATSDGQAVILHSSEAALVAQADIPPDGTTIHSFVDTPQKKIKGGTVFIKKMKSWMLSIRCEARTLNEYCI